MRKQENKKRKREERKKNKRKKTNIQRTVRITAMKDEKILKGNESK